MSNIATGASATTGEGLPDSNYRSPLMATYRVGRRLQRVRFVACEYCLGCANRGQLESEIHALRSAARLSVSQPELRNVMQNAVERLLQEVIFGMSDDWVETHHDLRCRLDGSGGEDLPDECVYTDILGHVEGAIRVLRVTFMGSFDAAGQTSLGLGETVESRLCDVELADRLARQGAAALVRLRASFSTQGDDQPADDEAQRDDSIASTCHRHRLRLGVPGLWWGDVRQRWCELCLSMEALSEFEASLSGDTAIANPAACLEQFDSLLESQMDTDLRSPHLIVAAPAERPKGYLDLELDRKKVLVGCAGYVDQTLTKLEFEVLSILVKNRETPSHTDALEVAWSKEGQCENPEANGITTQINRLKKKLAPLGLSIHPFQAVTALSFVIAAGFPRFLNGGFPTSHGEPPGIAPKHAFSGRNNDSLKGMVLASPIGRKLAGLLSKHISRLAE